MIRKREHALWPYIKPLLDFVLMLLSFLGAYWGRYDLQWIRQVEPAYYVPFHVYIPSALALSGVLLLVFWVEGAYRQEPRRGLLDDYYVVVHSPFIGIAAVIVIVFLTTSNYYSRLIFGYAGIITCLLVSASRTMERVIVSQRHRHGRGTRRVVIVGAGEVAQTVLRATVARPELGYRVEGFIDDDPAKAETRIGRYPVLGPVASLPALIQEFEIDEVIITLPWTFHRQIVEIMRQCERRDVRVRIVPDLFQMTLNRVVMENLDGIPLFGVQEPHLSPWQNVAKRGIDIVVSAFMLIVLAPVMGLTAVASKLDSPGPVSIRQPRVGRGGAVITCFKFRSMYVDAESRMAELRAQNEASGPLFKMRNDPRRTRVGRVIRRASIDEFPQFWNVLRGEMSLVGPRPGMPSEVREYDSWHRRRLEAMPGLTGLWQVSGRSDLSFDEMVLLDIYYIENWSPLLDLNILFKTVPTVLFGSGAY
jgi:exopolysaccharide biosynthesis polyprenyl glycosylphosphotransferase